jgi:HD-like signal output (HDOD) protein
MQVFSEIISKDVALSSSLLKTVNSPAFGLKRTVTDIKQSVIMIGYSGVTNIASFYQLQNSFKEKAAISLEKFWDTAMDTANMMSLLLENLSITLSCTKEDAYAFGLFRDCGIPLLAIKYTDYKEVLIEANSSPEQEFTSFEDNRYETSHATMGYYMAHSWNLPKNICELILRHHEPDFLASSDSDESQKELYALIKIAGNTLSQYKFAKDDCEWFLAKDHVLDFFAISEPDYQDIEDDLKEAFSVQFG